MGKRVVFSRNHIKLIALFTMVADHVGCLFVPAGKYPVFYLLLRGIGRISFPLICFLLVQGMFYTHSRRNYLLRLVWFALLSEIPFDLAFGGRWMDGSSQNVFFTLAIGLAVVWLLQTAEACPDLRLRLLVSVLAVVGGMGLAAVLRADYSIWGILFILAFYVGRNQFQMLFWLLVWICAAQGILEMAGLAALVFIRYYSPDLAGGRTRLPGLFFYFFYPVHLLLLCFLRFLLV